MPEASRKKLDPKARQLLLLSYLSDGKGFCLWDIEKRSIIKSRNVIFDHDTFPYGMRPIAPLAPLVVELPWPNFKATPPTGPVDLRRSLFEEDDSLPPPLRYGLLANPWR